MDFTPEEKAVVAQCLAEDPSMKRTLSLYWSYIIPLCVAAVYGFFAENHLISSASFFFLICEIIWFLNETSKSGKRLKSALIKYETVVTAQSSASCT
ncbi:hypothetical protein [Stutzerimonas nitrititolerans]|uniref:hypothetical protein n=1 Tax=Stutzerimonas nitrititolerans TaxID=2482751 RepID=UPI0028A012C5|nr:hypothetical protein [Stutzerimonas nitrititolerans]